MVEAEVSEGEHPLYACGDRNGGHGRLRIVDDELQNAGGVWVGIKVVCIPPLVDDRGPSWVYSFLHGFWQGVARLVCVWVEDGCAAAEFRCKSERLLLLDPGTSKNPIPRILCHCCRWIAQSADVVWAIESIVAGGICIGRDVGRLPAWRPSESAQCRH